MATAATESPSESPPPSILNHEEVTKTINSLLNSKHSSQDDFLYLILNLQKTPSKGRTNPYKIPLPYPLHSSQSKLCLLIDDRSKSTLTNEDAEKKVKSENICVSMLLGLTKLKSDYRSFDAKKKLCDSYDIFVADKRIVPMLPQTLGKYFYKKKKIPVPVDLSHKNWKEQIEKTCGSALFYLRTGNCSVLKVARGTMEKEEIFSNVVAAIGGIVEVVPEKWDNVKSFCLKFAVSADLPIYGALPDTKSVKIDGTSESGKKKKKKATKADKDNYEKKDMKVGSENDVNVNEDENSGDGKLNMDPLESKKRKKGDSTKSRTGQELNGDKGSSKKLRAPKQESLQQNKDGLSVKFVEESDEKKRKITKVLGKSKTKEMKVKGKKLKEVISDRKYRLEA